MDALDSGLIFVNLVDFDQLYGHRNDVEGYARALEEVDAWLPSLEAKLGPDDLADPDRRSRLRSDHAFHRSQPRICAAAGLWASSARAGVESGHAGDAIGYRPDGGGEFRHDDRYGREFPAADCAASAVVAAAFASAAGLASGWHLPLHTVSETCCRSPSRFGIRTREGRRTLSVSTTEPSGFVRALHDLLLFDAHAAALLSWTSPATVCANRLRLESLACRPAVYVVVDSLCACRAATAR